MLVLPLTPSIHFDIGRKIDDVDQFRAAHYRYSQNLFVTDQRTHTFCSDSQDARSSEVQGYSGRQERAPHRDWDGDVLVGLGICGTANKEYISVSVGIWNRYCRPERSGLAHRRDASAQCLPRRLHKRPSFTRAIPALVPRSSQSRLGSVRLD